MVDMPRLRHLRPYRFLRIFLAVFVFYNLLEVLYIRTRILNNDVAIMSPPSPRPRVYIASIHWNNEAILRESWNDAVVKLVQALGPDNVFVSVYESGSWDDSKGALRELDRRLKVMDTPRNITLSDITHLDEINQRPGPGWTNTPRGRTELRRIPYLSKLRNYTLWNLEQLFKKGIVFDQVLFLNDVVFSISDIYTLLHTNNGNYAAACAMDFSKPPQYYDTFALRDWEGHEHVTHTWPYFRSGVSRSAMKSHQPVPVSSCWNGIVAMPAKPFLPPTSLRFRGISDSLAKSHLEGSECCLIHFDNPESVSRGVFVNPSVRVAYNVKAYRETHPTNKLWLSNWRIFRGLWVNRLSRWFTTPMFKEWTVRNRVHRWKRQDKLKNTENGVNCLINEMQVLIENGWAHV